MNENTAGGGYIELTADIVSAYVSNNSVSASDIPNLINQVHSALMRVSGGQSDAQPEPLKPAISVKKSITPDYLVCLEDGKKFKSLKRHLRTQYNMTPEHTARNGACRRTIRWWRRTTRPRARNSPSRWASASSAAAARNSARRRTDSPASPRAQAASAVAICSIRTPRRAVADLSPTSAVRSNLDRDIK